MSRRSQAKSRIAPSKRPRRSPAASIEFRLRKHSRAVTGSRKLLRVLTRCSATSPCGNAACFTCSTKAQSDLTQRFKRHFARQAGRFVVLSLIPTFVAERDGRRGRLTRPLYVRRLVKKELKRAGLTFFVGALDFSHNTDRRRLIPSAKRFRPHLSVHVFGFALKHEVDAGLVRLRAAFPPDRGPTPRPIHVAAWDGRQDAVRYALKPNFQRRITEDQRKKRADGSIRTTRSSRKRALTSKLEAKLRVFLGRYSVADRLIIIGWDRE